MFSEYFSWLTAKIDSYLDSQLKQTAALLTAKTRCSSHVVNEMAQ